MPHCIDCDKEGIFLKINEFGLCKTCNELIDTNISKVKKIINNSIKVIEDSNNEDVKVKNCDIIIENSKKILNYEKSGILTYDPLPSKLIKDYTTIKDRILAKPFNQNLNKILTNFENELAPYINLSVINNILVNIKSAKDLLIEEGLPRIIAISNHKGGVGKNHIYY